MSSILTLNRRPPPQRVPIDARLEAEFTASYFANIVAGLGHGSFPTPENIALAQRFVTYGQPVVRYLGGKKVEETAP